METRPMLACRKNVEPRHLKALLKKHGALYVTPKLDGIRLRIIEEDGIKVGVSRTHIPLRNTSLQVWIEESKHLWAGLDGEIVIPGKTFNQIQSWCMSRHAAPANFCYYVFDSEHGLGGYLQRLQIIKAQYKFNYQTRFLQPTECTTKEQVIKELKAAILWGHEGLILRTADGPYKHGRCTWNEGYMLKMKQFDDSEAVVIGFVELQHNTNTLQKDHHGKAKRSKNNAGLKGGDTLGALQVRDIFSGIEFEVGSGWDHELAQEIWNNREDYLGKILTYKHQPHGRKEKPRSPIFKGFRYD